MARARRIDQNQPIIVKTLRAHGVKVHICSRYGDGFPDLLCKGPFGTRYLEVKMPGERNSLTKDQREFFGVYFDVWIVTTPAEALEAMGVTDFKIWSDDDT